MKGIKIIDQGFGASIQDLGRYGYRQYGLPVAGAMDQFSYLAANWLVRNLPGEAVIESIFHGLEIEFLSQAVFAITGGEAEVVINKREIKCWKAIRASRGDRLRIKRLKTGMRNYIAISGGFRIDPVLGSISTYSPAGLGGYRGRMLKKNDVLPLFPSVSNILQRRLINTDTIPLFSDQTTLRVTEGVNYNLFPGKIRNNLLNKEYNVSSQSNRMGLKLEGSQISGIPDEQILSYGIHPGTIQVPPDGNPIIMGNDCQTTGGYPQIANVVDADLYKLGQLRAGSFVSLKLISKEESLEALKKYTEETGRFLTKSTTVCTDCFENRP